jgi:iron complex transport system substrate-binding protein
MNARDSRAEAERHRERIAALGARRVFAVDAASTYSRPGPRLVDGVELLAHLFHPDRVDAPAGIGFADLSGEFARV